MTFEAIIGLEVHAQLATQSKMFCGCSTCFGDPPNTNICPVCSGQPGALPVPNAQAIEMAVRAGLAVGSTIQRVSIFARKNYFYPDLTKGYQISQYDKPLCTGGELAIQTKDGEPKRISIVRIHLEEDAGKLTHDQGDPDKSHVDFNRCGLPLIEIVSGPDMRSPEEASDYLRRLRAILVTLEICRGNLQEGNFRCDANVSIRPIGTTTFGTRSEVKNLNSFKAVERAIAFEIDRQQQLLAGGGVVIQETRLWNDVAGKTAAMREKEEAHDYRYFPDPDLTPLVVDAVWVEKLRADLPELPQAKAQRFVAIYGLPQYDADILTADRDLAIFFENAVKTYAAPKKISNWIMTELLYQLKNDEKEMNSLPMTAEQFAELVKLIDDGVISGKMAKEVFAEMYRTGDAAPAVIERRGFKLISDHGELDQVIDRILAANSKQVEQYKSGKIAVFGFLVGQVMKETKGQASPDIVNDILKKKLR